MRFVAINDFDRAGIYADNALRIAVDPYQKAMADSQRSLALGMQLLQRQIDAIDARKN